MSDVNDLIRRLRGEYRIPITDGLGAAGGRREMTGPGTIRVCYGDGRVGCIMQ